jgi:hypothetical protein
VLAAVASAVATTWLLLVVATVLPARDPGSQPFWTVFALAMVGLVALSLIVLRSRSAGRALRGASAMGFLLAMLVGAWIVVAAMSRSDFEGYLVLIGAVVLINGIAGALHVLAGPKPAMGTIR